MDRLRTIVTCFLVLVMLSIFINVLLFARERSLQVRTESFYRRQIRMEVHNSSGYQDCKCNKKIIINLGNEKKDTVSRDPKRSTFVDTLPDRSTNFLYRGMEDLSPFQHLLPASAVPNIVHFVWCGEKVFEFQHYLSVLSAFKILRADKIIIHYETMPKVDWHRYNQWINDLKEEVPVLVLKQETNMTGCQADNSKKLDRIYSFLSVNGGIYLNENVIITNPHISIRKTHPLHLFLNGKASTSFDITTAMVHGSIWANKKVIQNGISSQNFVNNLSKLKINDLSTISSECITRLSRQRYNKSSCIYIESSLFPHQIWERRDEFGALCRRLFYGTVEPRVPVPSYDTLVPNIAHYVWMGGAQMSFLAFLSVKSVLNVLKVDAVFLHGNEEPKGPYWEKVKANPKVHFIFRDWPETIFGNPVKDFSHISDVFRVDILLKYGGIYTDWDAVWVKPIDDLRGYDVVADYDWPDWHPPFPDKFNMGTLIAKKNARFLHYFSDTMKQYEDGGDWYYNACLMPYKAYERHPETVLVEKHLQVICFQFKCHPIFKPGYKDANIHHLNNATFDWRTDVYAVHWTMPSPPEFENEEALRGSNTMFSDIGKYVLDKK